MTEYLFWTLRPSKKSIEFERTGHWSWNFETCNKIVYICDQMALSIEMPSYQYRDSHNKCKTVSRPSYLYNVNIHAWKDGLYITCRYLLIGTAYFPIDTCARLCLGAFDCTWICIYCSQNTKIFIFDCQFIFVKTEWNIENRVATMASCWH